MMNHNRTDHHNDRPDTTELSAPSTVTDFCVTDQTRVGLERSATLRRIVLHLGGPGQTDEVILYLDAAGLVRIFAALGLVVGEVLSAAEFIEFWPDVDTDPVLWEVDYPGPLARFFGGVR